MIGEPHDVSRGVTLRTGHDQVKLCHLCAGSDLLPLIDFGNHPVSKHYLSDPTADQPTWPVRLFFCESCGLTQLQESCPPEVLYENYVTLSSWKPQPHAKGQIERICRLDGLTPASKIIEIGCNDGDFLKQLSAAGFPHTVGIEPSKDAYALAVGKGLEVIPEFLTPAVAESVVSRYGQFDVFISRQNLEHMADLRGVLTALDILLKPGGYVLIELPNFACNLAWRDYSLWEEHVNLFTTDTLRHFLALAGITVIHHEIILFSGEGIVVIGRKAGGVDASRAYVPELRRQNTAFAADWPVFRAQIQSHLSAETAAGRKIALYGAGSRVFCLVNFAGLGPYISVIVDDQVEKQKHFMPETRLPIVSSDALYMHGIDLCLLGVNTENDQKVIGKHAKWVEHGGRFCSLLPPGDRLLPVWKRHDD